MQLLSGWSSAFLIWRKCCSAQPEDFLSKGQVSVKNGKPCQSLLLSISYIMMNNLPRRMDQFGNKLSALMSLKRLKMVLRFHFLPSYLHLAYESCMPQTPTTWWYWNTCIHYFRTMFPTTQATRETYSPLASIFKICGIKSLIQLNVILTFCSEDWLMNLTARNYRCDTALFLCFDFWKRGLPPQSIVYYRCDNSFVSVKILSPQLTYLFFHVRHRFQLTGLYL